MPTYVNIFMRLRRMSMRLEKRSGRDLISELPLNIIDIILGDLPIVEAVRTSILSTSWRRKWASLTDLNFGDKGLEMLGDVEQRISSFITKFLLLHDGPIHAFRLYSSYLQSSTDIDQWLLVASRKNVANLTVTLCLNARFRVPSSVFSCSNLVKLHLIECDIKLPPNFKGFSKLESLSLCDVMIAASEITCIISSSPLLRDLFLTNVEVNPVDSVIAISAPNLRTLMVYGEFVNLYLIHTPLLAEITFNMHHRDAICRLRKRGRMCNFDSFLRAVPELERLDLSGNLAKFLSTGRGLKCSRRRVCSKITFGHLKFLDLVWISFADLDEIRVVLQLVLNSPILQVLSVSGMPSSDASLPHGIWDDTLSNFPTLNHLKTVELSGLHGLPNEMKFIEFLLSHSTCLQEMTIVLDKSLEGRLDIWNDVLRYRRSSPHASVCINYFKDMRRLMQWLES